MMNYKNSLHSSALSASAQLRILQNVKDELKKRKGTKPRKIFTKPVVAVLMSAVLIAGLAAPIGVVLHDRATSDNSVSGGLIITDNSDPEVLTPYYCAYKFDTNVFDPNNVEVEIYLGIDKIALTELHLDDMEKSKLWGNIIEYSIMPTIKNYKLIDEYLQENDIEYIDFFRNTALSKYNHGLYIWDKIAFDKIENFPFEKFDMESYEERNILRREFSYSERVTIPAVFFEEESGVICLDLEGYKQYENGHSLMRETLYPKMKFSYYKKGDKIYVENI